MLRVPRLALAILTLVCFASVEVGLNCRALAQSNIPAGTPLVPSSTSPLSPAPATGSATSRTLTTLAPLALPAAAPSTAAPGAPAALATTSALPALAPAPVVVSGGAVPVPQSVYTCSCFGVGLGTRWVGRVQSTNFLNASNAAAAQCTSYAINSGTLSPYIAQAGGVSLGRNPFPTVNPNGVPGNVAGAFRGVPVFTETSAAEIGVPARAAGCTRCACN
jgi:hypothetical protein